MQNNKLKILVLNFEYPPVGGGAGIVTKEIVQRYIKNGHKVEVITLGTNDKILQTKNSAPTIHTINIPNKKISFTTVIQACLYIIFGLIIAIKIRKKFKYQVIHSHFILPTSVIAFVVSKFFNIPYIISAHGSDVPGHTKDKVVFLHKVLKPITKKIIKSSHTITFPSQALVEELNKNLGTFNNQVVINHGIDPHLYDGVNFRNKENIVLTVARLSKEKKLNTAINSFSNIDSKISEGWKYIIVGDGTERDSLENLAKKSKNKILFTGWVNYLSKEYIELYKKSSIYLSTSMTEGFSMSLVEAMASKNAIISCSIPSTNSMLEEGAILINSQKPAEYTKALETLMTNKKQREELALITHKKTVTYTWDNIITKYEQILNNAVKNL